MLALALMLLVGALPPAAPQVTSPAASSSLPATATPTQRQILDAIRAVESGGRESPPDGNGGSNIGPYQISRTYWTDATGQAPSLLDGSFDDCRDRAYAERVVAAYMRRYCPDAWGRCDAEIIARTHAGGPRGPDRPSTLAYWDKVRAELEKLGAR